MLQCYLVIIDCGISAPGHGKEVIDGLNEINKHYIHQILSNAQLPVSKTCYSHIIIHSSTKNNDASPDK